MSEGTGACDLLLARLSDAIAKSNRGEIACLSFLTPLEAKKVRQELTAKKRIADAFFYGGYETAERVSLFLLPDGLSSCFSETEDTLQKAELLGESLTDAVSSVRVTGSKFSSLSHRDYLGAILALGIERDSIGDIAVQNEHEAVVFCSRVMGNFLMENLHRVKNDAVKCRFSKEGDSFTDGRRCRTVSDTVASARLDCVVAALTNLSRENAQNLIRTGLVDVEFEPNERTDFPLEPPVNLSIRGYGRYILEAFDGKTKKDRLRMIAKQLI